MRRKTWAVAAAVTVVAAASIGGVVALTRSRQPTPSASNSSVATAKVERGPLASIVSERGVLTYRARPDGSLFTATNQAAGTYTHLPSSGDKVGCGDVLYRVNERAVVLLCGAVPAYRALHLGDTGTDVGQLNRNLHDLGFDTDPDTSEFTSKTRAGLEGFQQKQGVQATGVLELQDAVFLPSSLRIVAAKAELGGPALPGTPVLTATADALEVQLELDPSQQEIVKPGAPARITLPGNISATGRVDRVSSIAKPPTGQGGTAGSASLAAFITLDDPTKASGLDQAPVDVDITTKGVQNALSVPVTALVGKSGGGFAVEVVHNDQRRDLVAVKLGLFDTAAGRVQVDGDVREGDRVVVPSA